MNKIKQKFATFKKILKENRKDILIRAAKTFLQAFLGSICIENFISITDWQAAKAMLWSTAIAGASAGISAIWNMGISCFNYMIEVEE